MFDAARCLPPGSTVYHSEMGITGMVLYRALNAEVTSAACFDGYVRIIDESSSALHVRSDLATEFRSCGAEYREWVRRR